MREPLPAHKRAEILVKVAGLLGRRHDEVARLDLRRGRQADEGRARRGDARDVDVHVRRRRGAQARRRDGADGRGAGRRGKARASRCACRAASSARSRRSTSRATSSRTSSRRRSRRAAPSCSSRRRRRRSRRSSSRSSMHEAGLPAGLAERRRRARRPRSATSSSRTSASPLLTFTGSGDVGWKLKERAPRKHVDARARQRDAGDRLRRRARRHRREARRERASRSPARAASRSSGSTSIDARVGRASSPTFVPKVEALKVGDPADEETDVGPVIDDDARERILAWIAEARRRAAHRRRHDRRRADPADGDREPVADDAKVSLRGGLRARS